MRPKAVKVLTKTFPHRSEKQINGKIRKKLIKMEQKTLNEFSLFKYSVFCFFVCFFIHKLFAVFSEAFTLHGIYCSVCERRISVFLYDILLEQADIQFFSNCFALSEIGKIIYFSRYTKKRRGKNMKAPFIIGVGTYINMNWVGSL